jgi:hypothetical protein
MWEKLRQKKLKKASKPPRRKIKETKEKQKRLKILPHCLWFNFIDEKLNNFKLKEKLNKKIVILCESVYVSLREENSTYFFRSKSVCLPSTLTHP